MDRMTAESIKAEAVRQGMTTLRHGGWEKVLAGITTPEEVMETTEADGLQLLAGEPAADFPEGARAVAEIKEGEKVSSLLAPSSKPVVGKMPDLKYINARKFQRMVCDIPVLFRIIEYQGMVPSIQEARTNLAAIEFEGHTRDISAGGVYFSIRNRLVLGESNIASEPSFPLVQVLESGSILEVQIILSNKEKPVRCLAKILRVSNLLERVDSSDESLCRVGASFLSLDSEDRCRLLKFLEMNKEPHEAV
jgi:hypothetical protein